MRLTPALAFAMLLSVRSSSFVQARRVVFFLANSRISLFWRSGVLPGDSHDNKFLLKHQNDYLMRF